MVNIRSIIKKPYYYVPSCPQCGSRMTGYFIQAHKAVETDWSITEALKNGELVEPVPEMAGDTCFCVTCSHTWNGLVTLRLLSFDEIQEEKKARHTNDILKYRMDEEREDLMERRKKHGKVYNAVTETLKGFLGIKK